MIWDREHVDRLFKEVLALEGEARTRFLAEHDPALATQLSDMLTQYQHMEKVFESSLMPKGILNIFSDDDDDDDEDDKSEQTTGANTGTSTEDQNPPPPTAEPPPEPMPERIGPYRVLSKIGEGGMGLVYRVRQEEPRRDLALKILAHHRTTIEFRDRFEAEYGVLALMNHHNIAAINQVGQTDDGHLYFTMEYVPGIPITRYCEERHLSLRSRILLFQQVCEGVMHAHQKAVVHRDLKPNNILVMEDNGKPIVKIIDFGIAKALEDAPVTRRFETRMGTLVGTLEYMSHEQLLGTEETDTRVDIYAMGVVFYEMLVDARPLDSSHLQNSSAEMQLRFFREKEPPPPSQRLKQTRQGKSMGIIHPAELRGDLDWVVLKAMEKKLERRYSTVGDFKRDLIHFLDDEPVSARSPSIRYIASKFVRRNRVFVGSGLLVLAAMVAGLWISITANFRVNKARLETEKVVKNLRVTNSFLQDVLESADPNKRGADAKVVDVLKRAEDRLDNELLGTPEVEASLLATLGKTYRGLGLYDRSAELLRRSYNIQKRLHGERAPKTIDVFADYSQALRQNKKSEEAARNYIKIIQLCRDVYGPEHRKTLHARASYVFCFIANPNDPALVKELEDVLETQKRVLGPSDKDSLRTMSGLCAIYQKMGYYRLATQTGKEAYEVQKKVLGPNHPQTLTTYSNIAQSLLNAGKVSEAEERFDNLAKIQTQVLGPDHQRTIKSLCQSASCKIIKGKDLDKTQDALFYLADKSINVHGLYSEISALTFETLANAFEKTVSHEYSIELHHELYEIFCKDQSLSPYGLFFLGLESNYLCDKNMINESISLMSTLLSMAEERSNNLGLEVIQQELNLGTIFLKSEKNQQGMAALCNAIAHYDFLASPIRWARRFELANLSIQFNEYEQAEYWLLELKNHAPSEEVEGIDIEAALEKLYSSWGKPEEAH